MIDSLTGLRAIAALLVFLFHVSVYHRGEDVLTVPGMGGGIIRNGDFGVDVFFALSGFVIAHAYASRILPFNLSSYGKFIWFRIARLWPLHLFTMVLMSLAFLLASHMAQRSASENTYQFESQSIFASLLMVHEWFSQGNFLAKIPVIQQGLLQIGRIGTPNSVAWSISAEFLAYLSFPFILMACQRHWLIFGLLMMGGGWSLAAEGALPHDNLIRVLYGFSWGVAGWSANQWFRSALRGPPLRFHGVWGASSLLALAGLLACFRMADGGWPYILAMVLVILLISAICTNEDWLAKILSHGGMVYLGEISYAFYMIHWFVIKMTEYLAVRFFGAEGRVSLIFVLFAWLASSVAAAILNRCLEQPARQAFQQFYRRRQGLMPG